MLLSATLKRQVFSNCPNTERWFVGLSTNEEPGAVSAKSFCFKEAYPYHTKILTEIVSEWEWKFFLLLPLPLCPNFPSWDVWGWEKTAKIAGKPPPWHTGWPQSVAISNPKDMSSGLVLRIQLGLDPQSSVYQWSVSSSHTPNWGAELDGTLFTTQGHLNWQMEKQTKSLGHPGKSWQPSFRQTSKEREIGANCELTSWHQVPQLNEHTN